MTSSPQQIKSVAIFGGAGNIGRLIVDGLLKAKDTFQITAFARPTSTYEYPKGIEVRKLDMTTDNLTTALRGFDAVVSVVGATGFAEQKALVDASLAAGVKRFIPSEFSANTRSAVVRKLVPAFEPKEELLRYLGDLEAKGLTWTGICTGLMLDWAIDNGFAGINVAERTADIWDAGKHRFSATSAADAGRAVVEVLKRPTETANQYLYVASVTTTQAEILSALEKLTGQKFLTTNSTTEGKLAAGKAALAKDDQSGWVPLIQAACWGSLEGTGSDFEKDGPLANKILGIPLSSVADIVKNNVPVGQ